MVSCCQKLTITYLQAYFRKQQHPQHAEEIQVQEQKRKNWRYLWQCVPHSF